MSLSESDEFEVIDQLEASLSLKELAKVHAWLQPTDYEAPSSEFHRHLTSQVPGTGLWICETSKYQQWEKSSDYGSLWIKGVPGSGKSVTAASIIEHLQKSNDAPVLYFFFRHIISANRRPRNLIQDFLAQLLPFSLRLQAILEPLTSTDWDDFSDERLWEYLLVGLSSIEKAYCVVDALDEMELLPNDLFLTRLNALATFRPSNVKLIMTSRPEQYLQKSLRDASIVHISLEEDLVGKDISLFLSYRLQNLIPQSNQQTKRESLVSAISERSRGLFLYARLLLDQITPRLGSTQVDVNELVKNLPLGLEEMYNSMLFKNATSMEIDIKIQLFLLELATHASRTLRLNELASALASAFPTSMFPMAPKLVARSACAPLLEILEDETVQVIHHSFTEFLLNEKRTNLDKESSIPQFPVLSTENVHKKLSIVCLDHLKSGGLRLEKEVIQLDRETRLPDLRWDRAFSKKNQVDRDNYQEAKLHHPFLEYAVENWAFHASKYDFEDDDFFQSVESFLSPNNIDFKKWLKLEWITGPEPEGYEAPTPLHVAAFSGLTKYAKRLLEKISVDARDGEARTPLHWASARGHISMVSLLVNSGATPNPEDHRGVKPIHEAARKNHASIVKILLEAGVDPLTPKTKENQKHRLTCGQVSTKGETAVEYVCLQGHTDAAMVILPFLTPAAAEEMFCQCCRYGKYEAARAILGATGLSPNSKSCGATALYLACRIHSVLLVRLLLEKGADVHQTSEWRYKTRKSCGRRVHEEPLRAPIHAVLLGWKKANNTACQQVLRLLLDAGADIEVKDANGDTPLLSLFSEREPPDISAVTSLLESGSNVLAIDSEGDSILHRCLNGSPNIQILKILFQNGARGDFIGNSGNTILHTALNTSHRKGNSQYTTDLIKLLLDMGTRCDIENEYGSTAIEEAASNYQCSLELFTVLLQACSNRDAIQRCIWKLRDRKNQKETVEFICTLQRFGACLEDRNDHGETVLLAKILSKELFEAFIECGADHKVVDSRGRGVLHHYILNCHGNQASKSLQRLVNIIDMGLDPMQVDHDGNNLLHVRAKIYKGEEIDDLFVQKALDCGISVNSKNNKGMTPLHVYLENWDFHTRTTIVNKSLNERFHERLKIPLLEIFKRNQETVNINSQDAEGVTILHLAAMRSEALLFYLLGEGADHTLLTQYGRNALHLACRARQSNIVGYLCHTFKEMINHRDSHGRTPLHDACVSGCPESVHHLLKAGADITAVDNNKRTPLHACAEFSDEQKLWNLLSRQNKASGHSIRDRFRPARTRPPSYKPWYAESRRGPSVVIYSSKVPSTEQDSLNISLVVKTLLSAGSTAGAEDSYHQTPLDMAIENDCQEMVQTLESLVEVVQNHWKIKPGDRRLQTVMALKSPLSVRDIQEPARREISQNPSTYLPYLTFNDVEWISKHCGNVTGVDVSTSALSTDQSLLCVAVSNGFTELVESFGPLARINDDPNTVLERICKIPKESENYIVIEYLSPMLYLACSRELSNMDMIEVLIEKCGVDVNARALVKPDDWAKPSKSVKGGTALHALAKSHCWWQLEALKYLAKNGAKIESVNQKGETPLHVACEGPTYADMNCSNNTYGFWRIEFVKILLELGADVNVLDNNGLSCLHKASSSPQIMNILLEHGADPTAGNISPIFSSIQIQCLETLSTLLDTGISPNTIDPNTGSEGFKIHYLVKDQSRSALFCASFANLHNQRPKHSAPMVRLLVERGADVYAPLSDTETLIHYVFENAEYEIVSAFIDCSSKIDFNTRDSQGRNVFLAACDWRECLPGYQHQHWELKKMAPFLLILELGANPLVVDNQGRNALHHLLDNPDIEEDAIIQFLAHDAAKNLLYQKDGKGFTPLHCALRLLRPAVVEVLLGMGADLLDPHPNGSTTLHHIAAQCLRVKLPSKRPWSSREHKPEYYDALLTLWKKCLAIGCSINVRDNAGSSPLFWYLSSSQRDDYKAPEDACCHMEHFSTYFSEEVVKDLDLNAKNKNGENVLHTVAKREKDSWTKPKHDKTLYEFFVGKGLSPLEEDGMGRSSLDIAAACEQKGILELFQHGKSRPLTEGHTASCHG